MTEKIPIKNASTSTTARSRRRVLLWAVPIVVGAAVIGGMVWTRTSSVPDVATPKELDALDPMVKAYVSAHIDKARSAPRNAEIHATLGLVLAANELWEEAGASFEAAAQLDPRNLLGRFYVGVVRQKLGDSAAAIAVFEGVKKDFAHFAPVHYRLGELRLKEGDLPRSAEEFQRVMEIMPRSAYGYTGLAAVRLRQNDYRAASPLVDAALERAPNSQRARYLRGLVYRKTGRAAQAEKELRRGLGASKRRMMSDPWSKSLLTHDRSVQGQIRTAMEFSQAGKHENARRILIGTLRFHPNEFHVLNNLGIAELSLGNPKKALEYLLRAERVGPRRPEAQLSLAVVYEKLGEFQKALGHARVAESLQSDSSRPLLIRAQLHAKLGQRRAALAALDEAERLDPDNPKIADMRGRIDGSNER